jgi:hypothetical protein
VNESEKNRDEIVVHPGSVISSRQANVPLARAVYPD